MGTVAPARELLVRVFGSCWLAEDMGGRLCEHLGSARPALHFGDSFDTLEQAKASRPADYRVVHLGERIALPGITPVPTVRVAGNNPSIPHEMFIFEFEDLLERGLRVNEYDITEVAFDTPPAHLMGKADFVATAVFLGSDRSIKVNIEYDHSFGLSIVDNPSVRTPRGYVASRHHMAFFTRREAEAAADDLAARLRRSAEWRDAA